jgi:uncharacterized membrane protein
MTRIPAAAAEDAQTSPAPSKSRKLLYVTLPGCWGGLIFACLSFTPSLLPRGGLIQGIICGITAAIGYGLGVLAASIWRAFPDREPRQPRRWAWTVFFIAGPVLFLASFGLGQYWQYEIRQLMGVTDYSIPLVVAGPSTSDACATLMSITLTSTRKAMTKTTAQSRRPRGRHDSPAMSAPFLAVPA